MALRAQLEAVQAELERRAGSDTRSAAADGGRRRRASVAGARQAERHANDRARAAGEPAGGGRGRARRRPGAGGGAGPNVTPSWPSGPNGRGTPVAADRLDTVRDLARQARGVADALEGLVVTPGRRVALSLPGGVARESRPATEHLLRAGAVVFVDGYNVAKLGWPERRPGGQRDRVLDVADDVARRSGSELVVVFDGADITGSHARRRRLVRVAWSPPGVSADDVIRSEVAAVPAARPVVVVTNDQAIRRDVAADGANTVVQRRVPRRRPPEPA